MSKSPRYLLAAAVTLVSLYAFAGERFIAILTNSGGKTLNVQGLADGGIAGAQIGGNAILTIQPSVDMYVCISQKDSTTNEPNCNAINGLRVPANAALPTSCPPSTLMALPVSLSDGGTYYAYTTSCVVEVVQVADAGSAKIWQRLGTEGL